MPPLDDATRFPALAPDDAGCRERADRRRAPSTTAAGARRRRRLRRHGAGRSDAGHAGDRQRRQGDRRLRAPAALRRGPLRRAGSTATTTALDARRAARRRAVRRQGRLRRLPRRARTSPTTRSTTSGLRPGDGRRWRSSTLDDRGARDGARRGARRSAQRARRVQRRRRRALPAAATPGAGGRLPHADAALPVGPARASCTPAQHHARSTRWSRSSIAAAIPPAATPGQSELAPPRPQRTRARRPGRVPRGARRARARRGPAPGGAMTRCAPCALPFVACVGGGRLRLAAGRAGGGQRRRRSRPTCRSIRPTSASTAAPTSRSPATAASTRARVLRHVRGRPEAGGRAGELDPARWSARPLGRDRHRVRRRHRQGAAAASAAPA